VLNTDAKPALNLWIELIDFIKVLGINIPVFIRWAGKTNVDPITLGNYFGKALSLMKIKLKTKSPINSIRLIRKFRRTGIQMCH